jgi:transposase
MFVRESSVKVGDTTHRYVQIVESYRGEDGRTKQRLLCSLGNKKKLDPAAVDRLLGSLARYGTCVPVPRPDAPRAPREDFDPGLGVRQDRAFGSLYALDRLWKDLGLRDLLRSFAGRRRFKFDLERATFAMVANRLVEPLSKLSTETWLDREAYLGLPEALTADHFYSTLGWLHEIREELEVAIHQRLKRRHLTGGTVYFYDTTLSHFEGRGPEGLAEVTGRKGAIRGKRHVLVGLVTTSDGWPVMHHVYPGTRSDLKTFKHVLEQLWERFRLRDIVIICDRGMHSAEIVELLENDFRFRYIVATKLRRVKEVNEEVLTRAGRYREVEPGLEVKQVWVEDRRYVVCRSEDAARRDRNRRGEILAQLAQALGEDGLDPASKKAMKLRTSSYDRYLWQRNGRLVINQSAVERDSRYDGKWVLRTNFRELDPGKIALRYKDEARIERDIRTIKSFVELRPTRHHHEETVDGHVFVCVLALLLYRYLQERLGLWPANRESVEEVLKELGSIRAQELRIGKEDGEAEYFWTRSDLSGAQKHLLQRLGLSGLPRNLPAPPALDGDTRARTQQRRQRRRKQPRPGASPDVEASS